MFFAAAVYVVFLAYPLLMEERGRIEPYLAAVIAGVPFFLFARQSLLAGGLSA